MTHPPAGWHLAQLNVGRLHEPLDHPATAEFVAALPAVNALADAAPGFVWRLQDEATGMSSSYVRADDDPLLIINLSVWATPESLRDFVYRSDHTPYLRRRREWFARMDVFLVCWWVPAGHVPTVEEATDRLELLRRRGPSAEAFTLRDVPPVPVATA